MAVRSNCGPHALAAVAGLPVEDVERQYATIHGKGPRWRGKSRIRGLRRTAYALGVDLKREDAGGTLKRWVAEAIPGRRYLIRVGGHFVAVISGKVIDQHGNDRLEELARTRVTHAYFIQGD